jgi:hypothetical protein
MIIMMIIIVIMIIIIKMMIMMIIPINNALNITTPVNDTVKPLYKPAMPVAL